MNVMWVVLFNFFFILNMILQKDPCSVNNSVHPKILEFEAPLIHVGETCEL